MKRAIPSFGPFFGCRPLALLTMHFLLQTARSVEEEIPTCESDLMQSMSGGVRRFLQAASMPSIDQLLSEVKAFEVLAQPTVTVAGRVVASVGLDISPKMTASDVGSDHANSSFDGNGTSHDGGSPSELEIVNDWDAFNESLSEYGIFDNQTNESFRDDPLYANQTLLEITNSVGYATTHEAFLKQKLLTELKPRIFFVAVTNLLAQSSSRKYPTARLAKEACVDNARCRGFYQNTLGFFLLLPGSQSWGVGSDKFGPKVKQMFAKRERSTNAIRTAALLTKPGKRQQVAGKKKTKEKKDEGVSATLVYGIIFLACCAIGSVVLTRDVLWGPEVAKGKIEIEYGKLVVGQLAWKKDKLDTKWTKGFVTDLEPKLRVTVSADPNDLSVKNGTGVGWDQIRPVMSPDEKQPKDP